MGTLQEGIFNVVDLHTSFEWIDGLVDRIRVRARDISRYIWKGGLVGARFDAGASVCGQSANTPVYSGADSVMRPRMYHRPSPYPAIVGYGPFGYVPTLRKE
jgi:hypothetical protein